MDYSKMYNALLDAAKQAGFQSIGDAIRAAGAAKSDDAAPVSAPIASTPELQQLKALALAATPGEWRQCVGGGATELRGDAVGDQTSPRVCRVLRDDPKASDNAAYIAAASPAVVLDLIARIERGAAPAPAEAQGLAKQFGYPAIAPAASGDELPKPDECYVHIYPSDLKRMERNEVTATAFSVAVGCVEEESVPLVTLEQARAAVSAATKPTADLSDLPPTLCRDDTEHGVEYYRAADVQSLLATKPAAAPANFVLVPLKPTPEMIEAFDAQLQGACGSYFDWDKGGDEAYGAMLAAAPAAPMASGDAVIEAREQALEDAAQAMNQVPMWSNCSILISDAQATIRELKRAAQPTLKGAGE